MAKTAIDELGLIVNLLMSIFFGPLWNGINRILRGKPLWGVLHIITGGFFGILWIIDIVCIVINKRITILA